MPKGQCNCGEVAFNVTTEISDVFVCHCSICQRATGNNGVAVVIVKNDHFNWIRGEFLVKTWFKPEHDWQSSFCRNCGSPLPGMNDQHHMYIPVGLITKGGQNLKVAHHIFVDSKSNWDEIGDQGKQHHKTFKP